MALTEEQRRDVAEALVRAEQSRDWAVPLSVAHPDAAVDDAYAIGQMVTDLKVAGGRTVKGHKVGLTSKAMREFSGATEPDYGTIFDDWFLDEGTIVSMDRLNRPLAEIEFVFVLGEELGGPSVNAVDVIRATEFVVPAVEVVDSRYQQTEGFSLVDSISDAASCGFVMIGGNPRRLDQIDIRQAGGALYRNGEVVASGVASAVMGNPVNAVAWLARKLDEFGVAMQPGHSVLSGSFIAAQRMAPGDSFVADYGPLGQISFGIAPA